MILPAFGIVSAIIPTFARKRLFGYTSMVYATSSIAILSFIVWAHHMYTTGMPVTGQLFFMYATMLIAVPTGVKIFNWIATMWKGSMTFETPMLWAVGFIFVFTMGGFTGLILSMAPIDQQLHDTYYVVAHFHYTMVAGSLFGLFAGTYYWGPKWTGVMYSETRGKIHFWGSLVFFNITFFPMHFLGLAGMPRVVMPTTRSSSRTSTCFVDRRLRLRPDAGLLLPLRRRAHDARQGRARGAKALGRRRRPRMGSGFAGSLAHLRDPAQARCHRHARGWLKEPAAWPVPAPNSARPICAWP
jgi:heme/copper-type cytochrome/quinol oxidase subunit 1